MAHYRSINQRRLGIETCFKSLNKTIIDDDRISPPKNDDKTFYCSFLLPIVWISVIRVVLQGYVVLKPDILFGIIKVRNLMTAYQVLLSVHI